MSVRGRAQRRRVAFVIVTLLAAAGQAATPAGSDPARAFLASTFALSDDDLDRIQAGGVVARTLPADDAREIATLGVVRVKITPEHYVERLTDIVHFKRGEAIVQIGVFTTPPRLEDVAGLSLDDADVRSLRGCRAGDCGMQLPADAIDRFHREVDWRRAGAREHANSIMRKMLVDYVARYQHTATASIQYADQRNAVDLRREFVSLAGADTGGWARFPTLRRHLLDYPDAATPETFDLVYWSKEKVARSAVLSVTHLAISRSTDGSPADYVVASKHIYGTHYFDASLGLTVLVRDRGVPSPAIYLAYVNRSRVDVFGGVFGGMIRKIVTSRARGTVSDQLARLQERLEREVATR
jgi:hypothetical protein